VAGPASYTEIAEEFIGERARYERLAAVIAGAVGTDLAALHRDVIVQWRAKDVRSFVKKALRKRYDDPLHEIGDKAGVRVIAHYKEDLDLVEWVIENRCTVHAKESKLEALQYDQLGYLGVHYEVSPRLEILEPTDVDLLDLRAEVQVHTKAQSAWAVVSHDLLYKSPLDIAPELRRTITRLVALVELFDDEVARFQHELRNHPDFTEMQVLEPLDDLLVEFTDRRPDRALSALVVPAVVRVFEKDPETLVADVVEPFVATHRAALEHIYRAYAEDSRVTPLLFQPEALLIFASLDADPYRLREAWPSNELPIDLLESLANIWGVELADPG